jgi:hypothetical protein
MTRSALAIVLYLPLALIAWVGWLMVDWNGSENSSVLLLAVAAWGVGALALLLTRRRRFVFIPAIVAILLVAFTLVDVSPVQGAARAVRKIHVGMSEAQVRQVLRAEFPARFRPTRLNTPLRQNTLSFILGDDGRYNAAVVEVQFVKGHVVQARFLPD